MNPAVALQPPPFARPAASSPAAVRASARHPLGFLLFVLANAALFVRPTEIVPGLVGLPLYEILILACLAFSLSAVLEQFSAQALEERPVTVCVLGLFLAMILSHLASLDLERAWVHGVDFAKIVLYYLLFVGLVDAPARLRVFLFWLLACATASVVLAVLQFHGYVALPNLDQTVEGVRDVVTGQDGRFVRLSFSGIFHDPNEMGVLVSMLILLSLYWLSDRRSGRFRLLWLGPLLFFCYAISLTQSRGALLALLAGLSVFLVARFGWRTALLAGLLLAPLLLLLAGRQTDVSTSDGTAQERIQIWKDAMFQMRSTPLFGAGRDVFTESEGLLTHNSYLQCFVDLGVFGGLLFLGAFYLAVERLWRLADSRRHAPLDPEMRRLHPYLFGLVVTYVVGMMSLTLSYIVPTYTVLALATVYVRIAPVHPALPPARFDLRLLVRLLAVAVCGFAVLYLFVRLSVVH